MTAGETVERRVHESGFHEGERSVQWAAGVSSEAARLEGMLAPASLGGGAARFLADQSFAVLVAHDAEGVLWASPLADRPGFLGADGTVLSVSAVPPPGDPLHELVPGQSAGVIALDLERRRRFRINGWMSAVSRDGFTIEVDEAYGNCPSYIQQRSLASGPPASEAYAGPALAADGTLLEDAAQIVRTADTFFLGTEHPVRGADVSHKGGNPGFVRIEGQEIVWPDYAGNNMFNSMGNLAVNPRASLLFVSFTTGTVLQLAGRARIEIGPALAADDDTSTGRWVRFKPSRGGLRASSIRSEGAPVMSPHNPRVRAAG